MILVPLESMHAKIVKINYIDCLVAYPQFPQADNEKEVFFFQRVVYGTRLILFTPRVQKVLVYLEDNGVGKRFDGGLAVSKTKFVQDANECVYGITAASHRQTIV